VKQTRIAALTFLLLTASLAFVCLFSPTGYAHQFRDIPNAAPSSAHWLGTDDLGRDRLARVVRGSLVSLLLAPAAALIACTLAALVGGAAGFVGGSIETLLMATTDLFLSIPWLFLLITVRALMPLNASPLTSMIVTFSLLGALGWAAGARVVCADARSIRASDFVLLARASGCGGLRLICRHLIPNLLPVIYAQFWISIPVFIISEANLGILGLGVSEPLPSWGSLLRELESYSSASFNLWQWIPLLLLVAVVSGFQLILTDRESLK
jgi:peptide/nickel transport system permease protein